jgi:hypothetical protein
MLNSRQIGFQRARAIRESIDQFGALVIEQLVAMHFNGMEYGIVKARERMRKLSERNGHISKEKLDTSGRLYYYPTGSRPQHNSAFHVINRNWGFLYLIQGKKDYQKVVDLDTEYDLDILVADGFIGLLNTFTNVTDYWFIESDKASSKNKFEKVLKYTEYYKSGKYKLEHWATKAKRFPGVLIVTDTPTKAKKIMELIEKQNTEGIRFKVITVEEIKTEIMSNNI